MGETAPLAKIRGGKPTRTGFLKGLVTRNRRQKYYLTSWNRAREEVVWPVVSLPREEEVELAHHKGKERL